MRRLCGGVFSPPPCSNSLTSLLTNSYPPLWLPMGLQLIQLSEHTNTICFFSTNHKVAIRLSRAESHRWGILFLNKTSNGFKFSHLFPLFFFTLSFRVWTRHLAYSTGSIKASNTKTHSKRKKKWMRGGEKGEDQRSKVVKRRVELQVTIRSCSEP